MGTVRKADQPIVDAILKSLEENDAAVEKAMLLLGRRQTPEELAQEATLKHNNVGFSSAHARFGALAYDIVSKGGHLKGKLLTVARHIAKRYARTQLLAIAKEKAAQKEARGDQASK